MTAAGPVPGARGQWQDESMLQRDHVTREQAAEARTRPAASPPSDAGAQMGAEWPARPLSQEQTAPAQRIVDLASI
jgi:hypothetical protein